MPATTGSRRAHLAPWFAVIAAYVAGFTKGSPR